jgi:DNA-binding NarL/FixJ family response regulator
MKQPVRVFIIEEYRLFAEAVATLLRAREEIFLVGSTADPSEALERIASLPVDVLLIDGSLERLERMVQVTRLLKDALPNIKVIVLGLDDTEEAILNFIEAGASGYVLRAASFGELIHTIEAVHNEQSPCSPKIVARVFARIAELSQEQSRWRALQEAPLTPREMNILQLIGASLSNKEIAGQLNISLPTVKNHVHSILDKLHVHYRREAAQYAFANDMLRVHGPYELGLRQDYIAHGDGRFRKNESAA